MDSSELTPSRLAASFRPVCIDDLSDLSSVRPAAEQHQRVILAVLIAILDRCERPGAPHLIDTKLDILTGRDFANDDLLRGPRTIYAWIQGRGLEALAGHAQWIARADFLPPDPRASLVERTARVLSAVMTETERMRTRNNGRLTFMMTPDGSPLEIDPAGHVRRAAPTESGAPANFTDLFYAKGLAAASAYLGDAYGLAEAQRLLQRTFADIVSDRFASDQQPMDPKNPVRLVPGRRPQGPWMITIGAAALLLRLTGDHTYAQMGVRCIRHILQHHVNRDYDMWEYIDPSDQPFLEDGQLRSDPGHATEFAGLGLKFLRTCRELGIDIEKTDALAGALSAVLLRNFHNGFSPQERGLCKAYDLVGRRPTNTDMPWWSMPETIRAAMEAHAIAPPGKPAFADIARQCSNAFLKYYVRPDRDLMANQTINEAGEAIAVVPATPDADPGYHTGLSLIDALDLLSRLHSTP